MIEKYCAGCGLCAACTNAKFENLNGFKTPHIKEEQLSFCEKYCVATQKDIKKYNLNSKWGTYQAVYLGHSQNEQVRLGASSGGIITSVTMWLLKNLIIDGVIHSAKSTNKPWQTETFCSVTEQELFDRKGSRYAQSSPLKNLLNLIEPEKKYAFVGKPCDVHVLKNYMKDHLELEKQILYTFSFFCAGQPSETANLHLLKELGMQPETVVDLNYRGNGWPGVATATDKNGSAYQMSYGKSWGAILGRDVRPICRVCMDGIGEFADVACGDAWYLIDGEPDFTENNGRNVVFARTKKGEELLQKVMESDDIYLEPYADCETELQQMQKYQYERRATMLHKILAFKLLLKTTPNYQLRDLIKIKSTVCCKRKLEIFVGTCKRLLLRKIS